MEGGAPKGRRLDGDGGVKKSEGDRLKYAINESTLSTAARSPFPNGEGYETRIPLFSHCQSEYMHVWKNNTDGQSLPQWGRLRYENTAIPETQPFPRGEGKEEAASPPKKESQPRLAALGSPFQGKGLAWILPPSYGRRCPEGAEVGWGWRYEKERGDRLKYAINESTLSTADAVPLPPMGKAAIREYRYPRHKAFPSRGRCPEGGGW